MRITLRLVMFLSIISIIMMMSQVPSAQSQSRQQHDHSQGDKSRQEQVNERGDRTMGFSHAKTAHHFRLKDDGGAIEVTAISDADAASRDQIRRHLNRGAEMFSEGDFSAPMFIHGRTPPGVETMKRLKVEIKYEFIEIDRGAKVRISTANAEAVKAIHEFLRFQIRDHQTGDPIDVVN